MNQQPKWNDAGALEARVGSLVAAKLSVAATQLPHDITERLRVGRERALSHARHACALAPRIAAGHGVVGHTHGGAAVLGDKPTWGLRLASGLPLLLLIGGLLLIERLNNVQQVRVAAEIDAQLLADDLPPRAYADPGFGEFLRTSRPDQP